MTGRHIDATARMVWLTLRDNDQWTVARLVEHWRPTFRESEVDDALRRLEANGMARQELRHRGELVWSIGQAELPGMATGLGKVAA